MHISKFLIEINWGMCILLEEAEGLFSIFFFLNRKLNLFLFMCKRIILINLILLFKGKNKLLEFFTFLLYWQFFADNLLTLKFTFPDKILFTDF